MEMVETARSSLYGKVGVIVGFGFGEHPTAFDSFVNIVVYRVGDGYVLAMGEGRGRGKPNLMRPMLGEECPGSAFAPYAQRGIEGMDFGTLRDVMTIEMPNMKWEWLTVPDASAPRSIN